VGANPCRAGWRSEGHVGEFEWIARCEAKANDECVSAKKDCGGCSGTMGESEGSKGMNRRAKVILVGSERY